MGCESEEYEGFRVLAFDEEGITNFPPMYPEEFFDLMDQFFGDIHEEQRREGIPDDTCPLCDATSECECEYWSECRAVK